VLSKIRCGDVVVYNTPESGDGPELLIPGALLSTSPPYTARVGTARVGTARVGPAPSSDVNGNSSSGVPGESRYAAPAATAEQARHSQPPLPHAVLGITPPPGFGAPITHVANAVPAQHTYYEQIASNIPRGFVQDQNLHSSIQVTTVGIPVAVVAPQQSSAPFVNQNFRTVGNSLDWFGGGQALGTANPFANASAHFDAPQAQNSAYEADATVMDGASLLGSGFLDSLWPNDATGSKTKNPFATNKGNL
jgi:hypothetical protein